MSLYDEIEKYQPYNEQESHDRQVMLDFIKKHPDYLERSNVIGHFTTSIWTVNQAFTKTLLVYHSLYDSWSWIGGHADGIEDLKTVALRELEEETGVKNAKLYSPEIFSLEVLTVDGHEKHGAYVSSHLHLNVTYLAVADEKETLKINPQENKGVEWFNFEEALKASHEKWFVERIYKKLVQKTKGNQR